MEDDWSAWDSSKARPEAEQAPRLKTSTVRTIEDKSTNSLEIGIKAVPPAKSNDRGMGGQGKGWGKAQTNPTASSSTLPIDTRKEIIRHGSRDAPVTKPANGSAEVSGFPIEVERSGEVQNLYSVGEHGSKPPITHAGQSQAPRNISQSTRLPESTNPHIFTVDQSSRSQLCAGTRTENAPPPLNETPDKAILHQIHLPSSLALQLKPSLTSILSDLADSPLSPLSALLKRPETKDETTLGGWRIELVGSKMAVEDAMRGLEKWANENTGKRYCIGKRQDAVFLELVEEVTSSPSSVRGWALAKRRQDGWSSAGSFHPELTSSPTQSAPALFTHQDLIPGQVKVNLPPANGSRKIAPTQASEHLFPDGGNPHTLHPQRNMFAHDPTTAIGSPEAPSKEQAENMLGQESTPFYAIKIPLAPSLASRLSFALPIIRSALRLHTLRLEQFYLHVQDRTNTSIDHAKAVLTVLAYLLLPGYRTQTRHLQMGDFEVKALAALKCKLSGQDRMSTIDLAALILQHVAEARAASHLGHYVEPTGASSRLSENDGSLSLKPVSHSSGSAEREIHASGPSSIGEKQPIALGKAEIPFEPPIEGSLDTLHDSLGKDKATASEDAPDFIPNSYGKFQSDEINATSTSPHINLITANIPLTWPINSVCWKLPPIGLRARLIGAGSENLRRIVRLTGVHAVLLPPSSDSRIYRLRNPRDICILASQNSNITFEERKNLISALRVFKGIGTLLGSMHLCPTSRDISPALEIDWQSILSPAEEQLICRVREQIVSDRRNVSDSDIWRMAEGLITKIEQKSTVISETNSPNPVTNLAKPYYVEEVYREAGNGPCGYQL